MTIEQLQSQCESPIERRFLSAVQPELAGSVEAVCQKVFRCVGNHCRVDFFFGAGDRQIVVECDGREFHDYRRDQKRDVEILTGTTVTDIVRFRGADINAHLETCISVLRAFYPEMFEAGRLPRSLAGHVEVSRILNVEHGCKPIVRTKAPRSEVKECAERVLRLHTCSPIGRATDGRHFFFQFKTPFWDWKPGPGAMFMQSFGDTVEEVVDDLERRAERDAEPNLTRLLDRFRYRD